MIFKAIRYLIYSPLMLIVEDKRIENVDTHDPDIDIYDNYEVIGIRAGIRYRFSGDESEEKLIISLKPTKTSYYEHYIEKNNYTENTVYEQAKGE